MSDNNRVCFCFNHTADDIRRDFAIHNRSLIMEKIMAEKRLGNCQCGIKNPKGR